MTNDNYTELTNQELVAIIDEFREKTHYLGRYIKNHQQKLYQEILRRTNFLDSDASVQERIYCIEHSLTMRPECSRHECHNLVKWNGYQYSNHCSARCSSLDPIVRKKYNETNIKLHEDANYNNMEKNRCTKKDRYGDEYYNNREQTIQTNNERYGVDNVLELSKFKEKVKRTMRERHGVDWAMQSKEIREKSKTSCEQKYGVSFVTQTDWFKETARTTSEQKYGVDNPSKSDEVKQRICQTMLERHGVEWAMQSREIRTKSIETMIDRYGVDNYAKSPDYYKTVHKSYANPKYPGMTFATSWEFKVYDFLTENHIGFEYQPAISIPYEYKGTQHTYHPDFKVGDRIVEVKGDHFFRINENTGQEEMFCPYKGDLTEEEYEWKCGLFEAKHQCMIANGVVIIRKVDLDNLPSLLLG